MSGGRHPRPTMTLPKKIACVGSGIIGSSWALLYAKNGYSIVAYDVNDEALSKSSVLIKNMLATMVEDNIITQDIVQPTIARIQGTTRLDDISECDYVQESAIERIDVKAELLRKLEKVIGQEAVIASSTSGISANTMQAAMVHPARMVIAHPFNPPHLVPLVEVVRGDKTSPETVELVCSLMESLGKVPVRVNKQLPGFAANRLQTAVLRESLSMLVDGVIDADGLEKLMNAGVGLRWAFMGPLVTAHLAGGAGGIEYYMDHFGPLTTSICETLATWTSFSEPLKQKAIAQTEALPLVKNNSYTELVKWRDQNLIAILKERGYLLK